MLLAKRQRIWNVGSFHKAVTQVDTFETWAEGFDGDPFAVRHPRDICCGNGQDDVVVVQNLIVLEIVQQRDWCKAWSGGEEYRRSAHHVRWTTFQHLDQV